MAFLENVQKATKRSVYALIQRFHTRLGKTPDAETPWQDDTAKEPGWVPPPKVMSEQYDLERDAQFQYLISKCQVLKSIVEKVNRESSIDKEETLVLIHTVGHLEKGPDAVNQIFQRCLNADHSLFLKSRLKGNPMSCPKIRARLSRNAAAGCDCRFDLSVNLYPTPLIHAHMMSEGRQIQQVGLTIDSIQFQNLLQDYLKLRKQAREVALLLSKYEKQLETFFENAGIEKIETQIGVMKISKGPDGRVSFSLEMGPGEKSAPQED